MKSFVRLSALVVLLLFSAATLAPAQAAESHYEGRYIGSSIGSQCRSSDPATPDVGGMCRGFDAGFTTATFTVKDALVSQTVCADLYFDISFSGANLWAGKFCGQTTVAVPEGSGQSASS